MNSDQSQISVMNSDEPQVSASKDSIVPKGDGEKGANDYATKKTVLQGLLDMALLIRNSKILKDDWRHLRKSETLRDTEV